MSHPFSLHLHIQYHGLEVLQDFPNLTGGGLEKLDLTLNMVLLSAGCGNDNLQRSPPTYITPTYSAPFQWDAKDFKASDVAAGFLPPCRTSLKYKEYWAVRYSAVFQSSEK